MSVAPSSPRLSSPLPPTQTQIGIPSQTSVTRSDHEELLKVEQSIIEANSRRRIHPGTSSANMETGPSLVPLSELDSAFQLQEHLKALYYDCCKSSNNSSVEPISRRNAQIIASPPENVDKALWLYELCRLLINKCNDLIVGFLFDTPPCSANTCPEMRASEWQFLCAVHESPKPCCAIDYCCHTLDWATNIVTSQKLFPSRLSLGTGDLVAEGNAGVKHLANIFRRLHRIFAHAWFQHRQVYWSVENSTGLYTLFKIVCDSYDLIPAENYKLPPEAEGLEPTEETRPIFSILKYTSPSIFNLSSEEDNASSLNRNKTRRHIRKSPSVGSAVTTVIESVEDDTITQELEDLNQIVAEFESKSSPTVNSYEVDDIDKIKTENLVEIEMRDIVREEVTPKPSEYDLNENFLMAQSKTVSVDKNLHDDEVYQKVENAHEIKCIDEPILDKDDQTDAPLILG
ncbi:hypothetical protein GcM1_220056 [Golovinomyces cichoracearum]|uniref:MOB-like protein phocein n=1 Tax=Golovinomyces cichoracearum TaxID=62708 RepID=A0A420IS48_9PEZI|nr:hypothetical protein GcM1_220056 [Golovinomyces cichoracearum]